MGEAKRRKQSDKNFGFSSDWNLKKLQSDFLARGHWNDDADLTRNDFDFDLYDDGIDGYLRATAEDNERMLDDRFDYEMDSGFDACEDNEAEKIEDAAFLNAIGLVALTKKKPIEYKDLEDLKNRLASLDPRFLSFHRLSGVEFADPLVVCKVLLNKFALTLQPFGTGYKIPELEDPFRQRLLESMRSSQD